jgi:hypothetical protein
MMTMEKKTENDVDIVHVQRISIMTLSGSSLYRYSGFASQSLAGMLIQGVHDSDVMNRNCESTNNGVVCRSQLSTERFLLLDSLLFPPPCQ